ncbi:hypothetical protein F5X68DRAFT_266654 [Plectosphaerella plurivora]|uniref:Myosin class II heavy chain n=1 Tax=Plectosphaerella plurivora TaxID=936078 RepID=A0A9P9AHB4_9PEZI|nr:hypothetical protein F5X68DRAFT_266654 [Plectosphaerella plurivora]
MCRRSFACRRFPKVSSNELQSTTPPSPSSRDSVGSPRPLDQPAPGSPALSTTSTAADDEAAGSSPILPPLRAPRLPERARELLRSADNDPEDPEDQFGDRRHIRRQSFSSEPSDDTPIHHIQLQTPFLRPPPGLLSGENTPTVAEPFVSAAEVLVNRARRIPRGLTEDWIRQHTAGENSESRHWFSEGSESENSSLSGSRSDSGWQEKDSLLTPRAKPGPSNEPRRLSSVDTLTPEIINELNQTTQSTMSSPEFELAAVQEPTDQMVATPEPPVAPQTPKKTPIDSTGETRKPSTPMSKVTFKEPTATPRLRKKIPWKGKNILERGEPGQAPLPLTSEEQGKIVRGFDLEPAKGTYQEVEGYSQSRPGWPTAEDNYTVTLPDLNAWRDYVNELNEAKLRALGPSISPALSQPSRQASVQQYPPLPFSPPLPTSSASSNPAAQQSMGFPFPGQFMPNGRSSAATTPGIASSGPFMGHGNKFNPRQSISIPMGHSPFQPGHRASPSLAAWPMSAGPGRIGSPSMFNGVMSPLSPFSPDGMSHVPSPGGFSHQRHQSLQYPMLPHQHFMQQAAPARASPRLQELREDDEEEEGEVSPPRSPEPVQHNDDDLQAEIDEAEYHLEEQMRNELEHEDYSPHNEEKRPEDVPILQDDTPYSSLAHSREPSVQFQAPLLVSKQTGDGPVLHHPRPHSRGHSLTKSYFQEDTHAAADADVWADAAAQKADEAAEIETNPSNLGTPVQDFSISSLLQQHARTLSTTSNPWHEAQSAATNSARQRGPPSHGSRPSHGSKPSLSTLNVNAPEFKFNPGNDFKPGNQFGFSAMSKTETKPEPQPIQTHLFHAGADSWASDASPVVNSFRNSLTSSLKANVAPFSPSAPVFSPNAASFSPNAPAFSPNQSSFSFSASGPKFRPDAPAFTPFGGMSDSFTSATGSGNESSATRPDSIFGKLNLADISTNKKSKAVPIIPPSSTPKEEEEESNAAAEDADGRAVNEARPKRAKAHWDDGDSVPLFAEPTPSPRLKPAHMEDDIADTTTLSSTVASEQPTDSRAVTATSPSDASVDHLKNSWTPYEFDSQRDVQSFNSARPFGEDTFKRGHKKSLSATANAFTPGHVWSASGTDQEPDVEEEEESEDEREREATIEPPAYQTMASTTPPPEEPQPVSPLSPEVAEEQQKPFGMPALRKGLGASRFASPPKSKGLKASRFASPVRPEPEQVEPAAEDDYEPTFEEIDAIMDHLNQNDPNLGVNKAAEEEEARWHQPSPTRQISIAAVTNSSPYHAPAPIQFGNESPRRYHGLPNLAPALPTTELEDPFVDPPKSAQSYDAPIHHLNGNEVVANSDWDGTFSDEEQEKLGQRVQFFDGRVSNLVGDLLNARLQPLEKTLLTIERHFAGSSRRTPSSAPRERRSTSAEIAQSDADDEDDDESPVLRRSMSPRRDRKMDQIRAAVLEAFSAQQRTQTIAAAVSEPKPADDAVLHALEDMKTQLAQRPQFQGDELRDIIEQAVEKRMAAAAPKVEVDEETAVQLNSELQAKIADLEQRLYAEKDQVEKAIHERRDAEELASELNRKLSAAETRVEVEIMNRSVYDQRIGDLEDRLKHQESRTDEEVNGRRAAEDRLSEVQRLLRISSEEENRLREVLDEREHKLRAIEQSTAKSSMRMSLLEAAQTNSSQSQSEMTNRVNVIDADLRESRKEAQHYKSEFERVADMSRRYQAELTHALEENKQQQRFMDTLGSQLHENERIRESWRAKFISLQEDMAQAARDITEENARRTKREQALVARQEVLDAKLQAEARTRERIETELERLENGERQGLRAISEMKRLEALLGEMRTENHKLQQAAMRYQREFEEARESGASEVQRTRRSLQAEVDAANHQVNVVRRETDDHINKLTADLDQAMLDVESAKAKADMLVEEAQTTKETELAQLKETHANQIEDLQTRHAMQLGNTIEEAQKSEQLLLERLSLSSSKTEHLQDRVAHLEEKLEIAKEAALAAAKRAKSPAVQPAPVHYAPSPAPVAVAAPVLSSKASDLPERISPQALRESIMVLQEQLQAREQQIEDLEQKIEKLDPEAPTKISKRDDEITWLRELLAVRHGDLQDIIRALSGEQYDREAVKDAAIRLKANLQMEEQERERAMNGGSAINLPSIAQTLQNASPRVAQAVGPLKAAWGSWVKSQQQPRSMSSAASSPAYARGRHTSTPSRSTSAQTPNSVLSGLMTPPASGLRQTPTSVSAQPTAFANTGRRLTSAELAKRAGRDVASSSRQGEQISMHEAATPPRRLSQGEPVTPPMHSSAYDSDAHAADFDDNDFFEED